VPIENLNMLNLQVKRDNQIQNSPNAAGVQIRPVCCVTKSGNFAKTTISHVVIEPRTKPAKPAGPSTTNPKPT
jgi:hypothetical protein